MSSSIENGERTGAGDDENSPLLGASSQTKQHSTKLGAHLKCDSPDGSLDVIRAPSPTTDFTASSSLLTNERRSTKSVLPLLFTMISTGNKSQQHEVRKHCNRDDEEEDEEIEGPSAMSGASRECFIAIKDPPEDSTLVPSWHEYQETLSVMYPKKKDIQEASIDPWHELRELLNLSFPAIFACVLDFFPGFTCIALAGHIDSPKVKQFVDAAALSAMFTNITSLAVLIGLSTALDTLCAQAFGAGQLRKNGIYLQSALLVVGACMVPCLVVNYFTGSILLWLGQDVEIAQLAGDFSRITLFGVPFLLFYEVNRRLLQSHNILEPLVGFALIGNLVHVFLGVYLTYHTRLGFYGAALSRVVGNLTLSFCVAGYYWATKCYETWWSGWQLRKAVQVIPQFLWLGIPGMLMMVMEWWAFEFLTLMAGLLPDPVLSVSAHVVVCNTVSMLYMVYYGIASSGTIRIGNALGANKPSQAQEIARVVLLLMFALACMVSVGVLVLRFQIPEFSVQDPAAIQRASQALLVLVGLEFLDSANCVMQGIIRGTGKQTLGAITNAVAYFAVGLPVAGFLAFRLHWNVEGLWIGFGCGVLLSLSVCGRFLAGADWKQLALEAQETATRE